MFLRVLALATLLLPGLPAAAPDAALARARELHRRLFTLDTHVDTPMRLKGGFDPAKAHTTGAPGAGCLDFPRMEQGGLASAFFAVFVGQGPCTPEGRATARARAEQQMAQLERLFREHPDRCTLVRTPEEALAAWKAGRRAVFLGLENGYPLGLDVDQVDAFFRRGIRYITLCHTADNDLCGSSTDKGQGGLTPLGAEVVRRMNALGVMVDLSHVSDRTVKDVLALSQAPVLASHSCARALCDHPRNLPDALLRAIRDKGGVVQVCLMSDYLCSKPESEAHRAARAALEADVKRRFGSWEKVPPAEEAAFIARWEAIEATFGATATVKDLADHIDHVVRTIGIDHVGIGSDFDGGAGLKDCRDVSQVPAITAELLRRGYTEAQLAKLWGGNALRVLGEVQAVAARLQTTGKR